MTSPEKATGLTFFLDLAIKMGPGIVRFKPLVKLSMSLVDRWFKRENGEKASARQGHSPGRD